MITEVSQLIDDLKQHKLTISCAESCTGGMIAAAITDIAGASAIFDRGFVTYSNLAKQQMLGIPMSMITQYGAVSAQIAQAMAEGALHYSNADISIATTGIAGPSGGGEHKPVGTVFIASARRGGSCIVTRYLFAGDRLTIRQQTVVAAVNMLNKQINSKST